jgi:uncharacterized membrane protein YccC
MWLALERGPGRAPVAGNAATPAPQPAAGTAGPAAVTAGYEIERYDATIAELQRALRERRDRLDPRTVAVIERNLRIIDAATDQARRALAADPANPYLHGHLADQLQRKVAVLRQATSLAAVSG